MYYYIYEAPENYAPRRHHITQATDNNPPERLPLVRARGLRQRVRARPGHRSLGAPYPYHPENEPQTVGAAHFKGLDGCHHLEM